MQEKNSTLKTLSMAGLTVVGGILLATKLFPKFKNQSLSSWLIERGLFVYGMKEEQRKLFEHQNRIDDFIEWNTKPQIKPDIMVGHKVEESYHGPMQVFSWNKKKDKQPIIFYLHGGGYAFPPYPTHYFFLRSVVRKTNAQVIFPQYLKTPKYSYKESVPYVLTLYKQMLKENVNDNPIILMGDSSGGGMALGLADALREEGIQQPDEIIAISPWLDITNENPEIPDLEPLDPMISQIGLNLASEYWIGKDGRIDDPLVSPMLISGRDLARITLFVGTHEVFYPDILQFANRLKEDNIEHDIYIAEKMNHIYPVYPTPEGEEARQIISAIINKTLEK